MKPRYSISTYREGILVINRNVSPIRYSSAKDLDGAINAIGRSAKLMTGDTVFIDDTQTKRQMVTLTVGKNSDLYALRHAVGIRPRLAMRVRLSARVSAVVNGST